MSAAEPGTEEGSELHARLVELIERTTSTPLPESGITANTGLLGRGIGLDSIEVLSLVSAIEEAFDLTIADEELKPEHFATVGTLVEFVGRRLGT